MLHVACYPLWNIRTSCSEFFLTKSSSLDQDQSNILEPKGSRKDDYQLELIYDKARKSPHSSLEERSSRTRSRHYLGPASPLLAGQRCYPRSLGLTVAPVVDVCQLPDGRWRSTQRRTRNGSCSGCQQLIELVNIWMFQYMIQTDFWCQQRSFPTLVFKKGDCVFHWYQECIRQQFL